MTPDRAIGDHPDGAEVAAAPPVGHVLHVLNSATGGAALTTIALIEGLEARGITSSIVCHDAGTPAERALLRDAVGGRILFTQLYWWNRKTRGTWWKRPLSELRQAAITGKGRRSGAGVVAFAREQGVDLVHSSTLLTPEGAIAAARLGLPHVWHVRELVGPGHPFRFWFPRWFFDHKVVPRCQVVIANSEVTARLLERWVPSSMITVVPNGVGTAGFLDLDLPADREPVVVGMVASLHSRWKGHEVFIRAVGEVDRNVAAEFRIIGHDPSPGTDGYTDAMHDLVEQLGLRERLVFAGYQPDPVAIMRSLDILAHPTAGESFGRIVVEAMLAGRPVVGVDGGGVGELVVDGETGLLSDVGDAVGVGRAMERLIEDPALRGAMGEQGRQRAMTRYSADAMVDGVLGAYRRATSGRPAAR